MFVSQTQHEVYEYYREIASETSLPIIIYNNRRSQTTQASICVDQNSSGKASSCSSVNALS